MTVNFPDFEGSDQVQQAPKMKSFILFTCGHKFHKNCITEKLLIDQERRDAYLGTSDGLTIRQEQEFDSIQPYLVAPQYKPLAIFDKDRERRRKYLKKKISEGQQRTMQSSK